MSDAPTWPVRAAGLGPVAVGTILWRVQGQLNVTVVVKASFALVSDAAMTVTRPEPIALLDQHDRNSPARSLLAVRENAPLLRQVDVVLYGHAWAPPDSSGRHWGTRSAARLAVSRDGKPLIDKRIHVYGERERGSEPAPFERIALGYERALGGIGCQDNPIGVGRGVSAQTLPNLVDARDPEGKVACFGPVPATFPLRKRLLGGTSRKSIEQARIAEMPTNFDWGYFQCAPPDQRLDGLRGDEWLELEGLTEELRLRTRLPGGRCLARVFGGSSRAFVPDWVPLVADLLQIRTDRASCTIVWRGSFPVADEQAAAELTVVGGFELPDAPLSWPRTLAEVPADAVQSPASGASDPSEPDDKARTVVYERNAPAHERALAGATVTVDDDTASSGSLPWEQRPNQRVAERARQDGPGERPREATVVLSVGAHGAAGEKPGTPFVITAPQAQRTAGEPGLAGRSAPIPGAPWAPKAPGHVPIKPTFGEATMAADGPSEGAEPSTPGVEAVEARRQAEAAAETQRQAEAEARREAQARTKRQAEIAAEAQAKREAEAAAEAQRKAEAEAEARRMAEAQRFEAEQAAAKAEEARRAAELQDHRKQAASNLRKGMYGGFKKKP